MTSSSAVTADQIAALKDGEWAEAVLASQANGTYSVRGRVYRRNDDVFVGPVWVGDSRNRYHILRSITTADPVEVPVQDGVWLVAFSHGCNRHMELRGGEWWWEANEQARIDPSVTITPVKRIGDLPERAR